MDVDVNAATLTMKTAKSAAQKQVSALKVKAKAKAQNQKDVVKPQKVKALVSDMMPSPCHFPDRRFTLSTIKVRKSKLIVGSDCSGWGSEMWALFKLGVPAENIEHAFACDVFKWSRVVIHQNDPPPKLWFDDCLSKVHDLAPYVDLYVAGFPCQSFSLAGKGHGLNDKRGEVVWGCVKYIERQQPAVFVLENVKNLISNMHKQAFDQIIGRLNAIKRPASAPGVRRQAAYAIDYAILNSKNFGVPQTRERLYIVGRRVDHIKVHGNLNLFAAAVAKPPALREFLGVKPAVDRTSSPFPNKSLAAKNLQLAMLKLKSEGVNAADSNVDAVVDLASGRGVNVMNGICPTVTRARGSCQGFYLTSIARRLSVQELCKLQGLDPATVNFEDVPESAIGALAGNAMTIPVLAAVIREALISTDLATDKAC